MPLQDLDRVLCNVLDGETSKDFNPINIENLQVLSKQSKTNHGDSLPEVGVGVGDGVVILPLVSRGPVASKIKNDTYFASPTLLVKKMNQLDIKQNVVGKVVTLPPLRPWFGSRHGLKWESW